MSKALAFLFYSDTFLSGTALFTDEQAGKYIRLLCAQHLSGHLTEKQMLGICKTYDGAIWAKFVKDEVGKYYNPRLEAEAKRRAAFCESRRRSRLARTNKVCKTQVRAPAKSKKKEEPKIKYRDNVALKQSEYQQLCTDFGADTTAKAIEYLGMYKIEKNYTTKSDYLTIRRWVIDAITKHKHYGHKPANPTDYLVAADGSKIYEKDIDFSKLGK